MKRTLFHFTCREYLSSILQHGIDTGSVPLGFTEHVRCICLTEIPEPYRQGWVATTPKNKYRLTVELCDTDERLWKWRHFAKRMGMASRVFRDLNGSGQGDPYKWWVFLGTIPPAAISSIWCSATGAYLSKAELRVIAAEPKIRGVNAFESRVKWLSAEDALHRVWGTRRQEIAA